MEVLIGELSLKLDVGRDWKTGEESVFEKSARGNGRLRLIKNRLLLV